MRDFWIAFIAGFLAGVPTGMVINGLLQMAKRGDDEDERYFGGRPQG